VNASPNNDETSVVDWSFERSVEAMKDADTIPRSEPSPDVIFDSKMRQNVAALATRKVVGFRHGQAQNRVLHKAHELSIPILRAKARRAEYYFMHNSGKW